VTERIDGKTRLAGVVGWPLGHTLSPAMHNVAYREMGLNWVYVPIPVPDETALLRFSSAAKVLPFVGFNVTMPYKRTMMNLCDEVAAMAELAGAVNTVHVVDGHLIGYNTDGRGLLESLSDEADFEAEGSKVVLIGAGGAAGAALVGMILGNAASVHVVNRTLDKASGLARRAAGRARNTAVEAVQLDGGAEEVVTQADLVVNCTPLGMKPDDALPVPASWLREGQIVADMVYRPAETELMRAARKQGAVPIGGMGMLVNQGAIAVEIWESRSQKAAPRDVMRAAAEAQLARVPANEHEAEQS
jgi:shikimate dehydrogenase